MREVHVADPDESEAIRKILQDHKIPEGETFLVWGMKKPTVWTVLSGGAVMKMPLGLAYRLGKLNHGEG